MQGSYIKIWVPFGSKFKEEQSPKLSAGPFSAACLSLSTIETAAKALNTGGADSKKKTSFLTTDENGYVNHMYDDTENDTNLVSLGFVPIEERIELLLKKHGITYVNKTIDMGANNNNTKTVTEGSNILIQFFVPESILESILIGLQKCGVGVVEGTGLSLIPTVVNYFGEAKDEVDGLTPQTSTTRSISSTNNNKQLKMNKFYKSIKSRLIVADVIKRIEGGAEFSFDFVCYLIVAACLAFMGLVENSSVILVASMLVSPIMGPILAIVFGTSIRNKKLVKIGLKREIYSLLICIVCGFIFGCIFVVKLNRSALRSNSVLSVTSATWPTAEMASRTGWSCLVVGLAIAIPSGVGVAISVLGGNAGSMVGVAISASLLPPAVNTGLFWAMSLISYGYGDKVQDLGSAHETFKFEYATDDIPMELFLRGVISLILTVLNIVCIVIVGVFILFVKQVTPDSIPQRNAAFWKKDILLNREYEKSLLDNQIFEAMTDDYNEQGGGISGTILENLFKEAVEDKQVIESREWIERNYQTDDLNKMSDQTTSLTSSPVLDSRFFHNKDRFKISPVFLSMRQLNHPPRNRDVALLIEEEVKNALEKQGRNMVQRSGSLKSSNRSQDFILDMKRASLPRL